MKNEHAADRNVPLDSAFRRTAPRIRSTRRASGRRSATAVSVRAAASVLFACLLLSGLPAAAQQGARPTPAARQAAGPAPVAQPESLAQRNARELLNSERIEEKFGSYGIRVLHSDAALRVSHLYSEEQGRPIGRTFAVVLYPATVHPLFAEEHAAILDGGSIGAVFTRGGWTVTKSHRYFGELESTPRVAGLMRLEGERDLAVHVYVLQVAKDGASFEYATIAELHHPEYLQLDELRAIYGEPAGDAADATLVRRVLDATVDAMQ